MASSLTHANANGASPTTPVAAVQIVEPPTTATSITQPGRCGGLGRVVVLSFCYACGMSSLFAMLATTSIAVVHLGYGRGMALVPMGLLKFTSCLTALTCSRFCQHRSGFLVAICAGFIGAIVCVISLTFHGDDSVAGLRFVVLCCGHMLMGVCDVGTQFLRFLAFRLVEKHRQPQAISLTIAGGIMACIFGPEMAKHTVDVLIAGQPFAATFVGMACLYLCYGVAFACLNLEPPRTNQKDLAVASEQKAAMCVDERPLLVRVRSLMRVDLVLAVIAAATSFSTMLSIMNATPLVLVGAGFSLQQSSTVIQAHILGMFVPTFFSGGIVRHSGWAPAVVVGLGSIALSAAMLIATASDLLAGVDGAYTVCLLALALLGVGWCFGYVGATVWLTQTYSSEESSLAQGLNDCAIHFSSGVAIISTGFFVDFFGWKVLLATNGIVALIVALLSALLAARRRKVHQVPIKLGTTTNEPDGLGLEAGSELPKQAGKVIEIEF